MGLEARCTVRHGRRTSEGRALLETSELIFRGEFRLAIPFRDMMSVRAVKGRLEITWPEGAAVFELGDAAARWAGKIQNPRSRIDKLGVKPGHRVSVVGVDDAGFREELTARAGSVHVGRIVKGSDLVFLGVDSRARLARLAAAERAIARNGAIWVVWPKGRRELNEDHVRAAALGRGLVDVKVAAFSATLSALKLVIPVARR